MIPGATRGQEGACHLDGRILLSRRIALPVALCAAVFLVASYSMTFPKTEQGINSIWLANGVSVAALLRSPVRDWPMLVIAAMAGNTAALLYSLDIGPFLIAYRVTGNALQYWLCAWLLRRRFGADIDITETAQLVWIGLVGALTTGLKLAIIIAVYAVLQPDL
ncbi:MAG: hypothetical protein EON93_17760, partial [Burkholderiales bacterium]